MGNCFGANESSAVAVTEQQELDEREGYRWSEINRITRQLRQNEAIQKETMHHEKVRQIDANEQSINQLMDQQDVKNLVEKIRSERHDIKKLVKREVKESDMRIDQMVKDYRVSLTGTN